VRARLESEINGMKATIWHNPNCGTSRKTLAILESLSRIDLTVVEYLKDPPTTDKLAQLYADAGITPQEGLRLRGTDAEERGLPDADAGTVLAAMAADPILINRPLVETEKGVRLCRPQDVVLEIL
jgi:arsenate reductase (glutaredoxin)